MTFYLNKQLQLDAMLLNSMRSDQNEFHHYVAMEAAVKELMIASVTQANITGEVIQRALGISDHNALCHYAEVAATKPLTASSSPLMTSMNYADWNQIERDRIVSEVVRAQAATQHNPAMYSSAEIDQARGIAELAQTYKLHAALEPFRTAAEPLASKLLYLQSLDTIKSPAYLDAFMQASTISDAYTKSIRVDHQLNEAVWQFSHALVPKFDTLNDYGQFHNAAGLRLPHWPHIRLLTIGEKRRRLRAMLNKNAEPVHVKKAKSLVHRYELTLRVILECAMTREYGEDWAEERLPLCDCKKLLEAWRGRGEEVLDHADFAHYEWIMSHSEHF